MDKLAVITPVFNSEHLVADCIRSMETVNTDGDLIIQHIVIDDGSTDNTWAVIDRFERDGFIKIKLPKNTGASAARNTGIKHTDASYLYCLDADDVIFQNSLVNLYRFIRNNHYNWVYGDFLRGGENLQYLTGRDYWGHDFKTADEILISMLTGKHFFQQNCMYTRNIFDQVNGFDETKDHFQDFDLFIRMAMTGNNAYYLPGPLYIHRYHPGNLSKRSGAETNPNIHRGDIKKLYENLKKDINKFLIPKDIEKIERFIDSC